MRRAIADRMAAIAESPALPAPGPVTIIVRLTALAAPAAVLLSSGGVGLACGAGQRSAAPPGQRARAMDSSLKGTQRVGHASKLHQRRAVRQPGMFSTQAEALHPEGSASRRNQGMSGAAALQVRRTERSGTHNGRQRLSAGRRTGAGAAGAEVSMGAGLGPAACTRSHRLHRRLSSLCAKRRRKQLTTPRAHASCKGHTTPVACASHSTLQEPASCSVLDSGAPALCRTADRLPQQFRPTCARRAQQAACMRMPWTAEQSPARSERARGAARARAA
jgi:hypothetical protein